MPTAIYRFKLSDSIYTIITNFAKLHQYDERKDYKEAWKVLVEANEMQFSAETKRLTRLGYKGDVIDKMYKSGRYYFKSKSSTEEVKCRLKKTTTIKLSKYVLETIDSHIKSKPGPGKPADRYNDFCKDHKDIISRESVSLDCTEPELMAKIKKSYKNRYFTIQKKKDIA